MNDHELFDERDIRRALRLDADEMAPRLDPRIVAAAARASGSSAATGIVLAAVVAFLGGWVWSEVVRSLLSTLLAAAGVDPLGTVIDAVSALLVWLAPVAQAATAPAVPIAILVVAVMATLFDRMKGRSDATPS